MYIIGIQYNEGDIQICFTGKINELESNDELKNRKDNSSIGVDREFAQEGGITIKPEYHRRYNNIFDEFKSRVRHLVYRANELTNYEKNEEHDKLDSKKIKDDYNKRVSAIVYGTFEECTNLVEKISHRRGGSDDTNNITGICIIKKSLITKEVLYDLKKKRYTKIF